MHPKRRSVLVLAFRIGILDPGNAPRAERAVYWDVMLRRLQELGYEEGRNLVVDMRRADGNAAPLREPARALAATNPDVIVVSTTPGVRAVMAATSTIPTVFPTAGNRSRLAW